MRALNVYTIKLVRPVKIDRAAMGFGSADTSHLYVVASSFEAAIRAVLAKYPELAADSIRGVDLVNYTGVPIVIGD